MKNSNEGWTEDFLAISSVAVPVTLILLSILTPKTLVSENQKEILLTAGITLLLPGGFRGFGKKTEIRQQVQQQEMNLSSSVDYVEYAPSTVNRDAQLTRIEPTDERFLDSREHVASSPYRVVSPDDE